MNQEPKELPKAKELLILSGKGGTGKTTIVGALAALAKNKVLVDCDVDAADLHLILRPQIYARTDFYSGRKASIDRTKCSHGRFCRNVCRFEAINGDFFINPLDCIGCGTCALVCPNHAISLKENLAGEWYISQTKYGRMVHAQLGIAEDNSGKLVAHIREQARQIAQAENAELILIDGPPGIGCPVLSSLSGVDLVLMVTEPTVAGIHDLGRVLEVAEKFSIPCLVCINKYDLDPQKFVEIEAYCQGRGVGIAGQIPFDSKVVEALVNGSNIIDYHCGPATTAMEKIWHNLSVRLNGSGNNHAVNDSPGNR